MHSDSDHQKKLIRADERIDKASVKEHVEGKGNVGSEKQDQGKTKGELEEMARKKDLKGRSQMNKEELVQHLKEE